MENTPEPADGGPGHHEGARVHREDAPAGFALGVVGAAGIVHHFVPGFALFAFVARIPFVSRYDLYVSATLLVLGVALLIAGDRIGRPRRPKSGAGPPTSP